MASDAAASPRESYLQSTPNDSATNLAVKNEPYIDEDLTGPATSVKAKSKRRPLLIFLIALAVLIVVVLAVILPVYFTVIKPKNNGSSPPVKQGTTTGPHNNGTGTGGTTTPPSTEAITGGDGSTIKAADGSTFQYNNKFGGIWYSDPNDPYNLNAYPNSWTPPLNQSWNFATNRMLGVNLGGWFVLEPFISPALFQKYPGATDEWSLSVLMAADTASGGLSQIEDHYKTFITEADIAEIAGAGLNWVRIPIPYWAIDKWGDEPWLEKTSWKYIVQALQWCRKYGIRVKLDLHTIPGSQNAYNHSGKGGQVNFLHGVMGMANAQRALNYMRIITQFISQPEWKEVVPIFGIINEALATTIGDDVIRGFYVDAYNMIRGITGTGEGNGPYISIHDSFEGLTRWAGFLSGSDRMILDQHPYFAFRGGPATEPMDTGVGPGAGGTWPEQACQWAEGFNTSRTAFGVTLAGEWSNGYNDCGLFLTGVNGRQSYGGNCADWRDSTNWSAGTKAGLMRFSMAQMDAMRDYFFWTWKIGTSAAGIVESPLWSYQLGLRNGWMPTDPRAAVGTCGASTGPIWDQTFQPWMTGGVGAGNIGAAAATYPYPPVLLPDTPAAVVDLPLYTATGTIATLPAPTYTDTNGKPIAAGNGWFNAQDTTPAPTPIAGCTYPDPWDAVNAVVPGPTCVGGGIVASVTPPPRRAL
ncbi:glycoside hydrolase superfamily [Crassisporium funariophilum]|nr:glycoside hydrolase superfamily [Crassisporium funariophilum]